MKLLKYGLIAYGVWWLHKAYHEGTLRLPELPALPALPALPER